MPRRKPVFDYFLQLPPELRQQIYRFSLFQNLTVRLSSRPNKLNRRHATNLLLVCQQIYNEAVQVFYRVNIFQAWDPKIGYRMLKTIGSDLSSHLRHFVCVLGRDSFTCALLRLLAKCRNLRELGFKTTWSNLKDLIESDAFIDMHVDEVAVRNSALHLVLDTAAISVQILSCCTVTGDTEQGDQLQTVAPWRKVEFNIIG